MPIYEYQCLQCGTRTEHLQKISDPPLPACPKCGGEVKKLISSPAFQFKGSGWYATDYAGKSGAKTDSSPAAETKTDGAKSDGAASSSAETKSELKPESKSESKSEAKPEKKETAAKGD